MLTVNLCVDAGLFNGATGNIVHLIYPEGITPSDGGQPSVVVVDFPKYKGPAFVEDHPTYVPIHAVDRRLDCECCSRKQIPLRLGWGTTIHRCQGMTIGNGEINKYIIISPGSTGFESKTPGALYVALSRAKTAGTETEDPEFAFHQSVLLNEDRICHKVKTKTTRARDNEINRINTLAVKTREEYSHLDTAVAFNNLLDMLDEIEGSQPEE